MAEVLNLNDEVVKMRKEVKKVRALIIRKLIRQISGLKKKKGKEGEQEKNQRRAARLVEEVNQMKGLKPDYITKIALQKHLNFEKICKDPKATLLDRATVRIATHPQISKRIVELKTAVKAFKDERQRPTGTQKKQAPAKPAESPDEPSDLMTRKEDGAEGKDVKDELASTLTTAIEHKTPKREHSGCLEGSKDLGPAERGLELLSNEDSSVAVNTSQTVSKNDKVLFNVSKNQAFGEKETVTLSQEQVKMAMHEEQSDLDSAEEVEDREYFDDSTEERFHKQSSYSENSDDDDDFFLGKVKKFKKKRHSVSGEAKTIPTLAGKVALEKKAGDEQKVRREAEASKLETVFCKSLSASAGASVRGQKGPTGAWRKKTTPAFHRNPVKPASSVSRNNVTISHRSQQKTSHFGSQARDHIRKVPDLSQKAQQTLHPSWEASRRRKEQQAHVTAFQGKKIRFDDD